MSSTNDEKKWTRIETADQELSLAFPPDYVVDAEKKQYKPIYKITGFSNDVIMEIAVSKSNGSELKFMRTPEGMSSQSFTKKDLKGVRNFTASSETFMKETISILGDKNYYFISVTASDRKKPEIERFLYSIKIKGESLFQNPNAQNYPENSIAMKSLSTSPEAAEAWERKLEKKKFKTEKNISADAIQIISYAGYSRPPIVVEQPYPSFRPPFETMGSKGLSLKTRLKVTLLADGQVGGVTVLGSSDDSYTNACVDAARKLRFIPAQKNGVNADSVKIVDYNLSLFKTGTMTIPGGVLTPVGSPF